MARLFRRVKGTNKDLDKHALENDRRPFVFNFATSDGGTGESQGSVLKEDAPRLMEIFNELQELQRKGQKW